MARRRIAAASAILGLITILQALGLAVFQWRDGSGIGMFFASETIVPDWAARVVDLAAVGILLLSAVHALLPVGPILLMTSGFLIMLEPVLAAASSGAMMQLMSIPAHAARWAAPLVLGICMSMREPLTPRTKPFLLLRYALTATFGMLGLGIIFQRPPLVAQWVELFAHWIEQPRYVNEMILGLGGVTVLAAALIAMGRSMFGVAVCGLWGIALTATHVSGVSLATAGEVMARAPEWGLPIVAWLVWRRR